MEIKVGHKYKTRDGSIAAVLGQGPNYFIGKISNAYGVERERNSWTLSGSGYADQARDHEYDLVEDLGPIKE
jgi:hypothetical protein